MSDESISGADLLALINEATLVALRQRIEQNDGSVESIRIQHFEEAIRRVAPSVRPEDRERYRRLKEKYAGHRGKMLAEWEEEKDDG